MKRPIIVVKIKLILIVFLIFFTIPIVNQASATSCAPQSLHDTFETADSVLHGVVKSIKYHSFLNFPPVISFQVLETFKGSEKPQDIVYLQGGLPFMSPVMEGYAYVVFTKNYDDNKSEKFIHEIQGVSTIGPCHTVLYSWPFLVDATRDLQYGNSTFENIPSWMIYENMTEKHKIHLQNLREAEAEQRSEILKSVIENQKNNLIGLFIAIPILIGLIVIIIWQRRRIKMKIING